MKQSSILFVGFLTMLYGCHTGGNQSKKYVFFGHTYQSNAQVDERIQQMDLTIYDQIWLGGDLCSETTENRKALEHLNNVFDIGKMTTHWTLGNHDIRNGNIDWITEATHRPTFYTISFEGITLLVLNTNFKQRNVNDSLQIEEQYKLIKTVCDTISKSSHLLILTHHVVWEGVDDLPDANEYANGKLTSFPFKLNPRSTYKKSIYPMLQEVQRRGVQVIHISGDLGQKTRTKFEYRTQDGIQFLGSGILSKTKYNQRFPSYGQPSYFLEFTHDISKREITWKFKELISLK